MKKLILAQALTLSLLIPAQAVLAADVTGLTTFSSGTPAVASQVNGNFSAVKSAVDNNHARISTLESSPRISGNIRLVLSTATTGNILKGGVPFLHDFGGNNTFLGENAGNFTMTGNNNTASGARALQNNTTGSNNTASGVVALVNNTTGSNNTASGEQALQNNTTGTSNTAFGFQTLFSNTTGSYNTAIGMVAGSNLTTGSNNIAIGLSAGSDLTTGSSNIAIGNRGVPGESFTIRIGANQNRAFIGGISGVAVTGVAVLVDSDGQLGTASSSQRFKDNIADMGDTSSVLKQLRPVTFHYKSDQNPKGRSLQYGLIAEEVEKVAPGLVARSANGEIETVFYQHLTPMLLNEYQKQQRIIETQTAALAKQTVALSTQTERVAELEQERRLQTARIETLEKQALEIVALKQELARMTAVVASLRHPERVASAGR